MLVAWVCQNVRFRKAGGAGPDLPRSASEHCTQPCRSCRIFAFVKRPLAHRLFSVWLALLVLTSSVGLAVQQHTCRVSGQHTAHVVFSTAQHGCPPAMPVAEAGQPAKAKLQKSCCEFSAQHYKVDLPTAGVKALKLVPPAFIDWLLPSAWPQAPLTSPARAQAAIWHAADASPPRPAGRQLLTFVCLLVV